MGIPYVVEHVEDTKLPMMMYDDVESAPNIPTPTSGTCSKYYHGLCLNTLLKLICRLSVGDVKLLLNST